VGSIYARFRRPDGTTDAQLHHDDPRSGTTPAVPDEIESAEAELVCVSLGATVDGLVERLGVTRRSVLPVLRPPNRRGAGRPRRPALRRVLIV
jgi:hypothetical protein